MFPPIPIYDLKRLTGARSDRYIAALSEMLHARCLHFCARSSHKIFSATSFNKEYLIKINVIFAVRQSRNTLVLPKSAIFSFILKRKHDTFREFVKKCLSIKLSNSFLLKDKVYNSVQKIIYNRLY